MEPPESSPALPAVWICPKCGARLVSRNLWHSCGQYTLETLFTGAAPGVLELAREYVAMLHSLGDVQVIAQKTRLVGVARVRFAGLSPRKRGFQASFALHRWLDSPRIVKQVDYGPRWRGHHIMVQARSDLDDELRGWLQEAHDVVGLQADLPKEPATGQAPAQVIEAASCKPGRRATSGPILTMDRRPSAVLTGVYAAQTTP